MQFACIRFNSADLQFYVDVISGFFHVLSGFIEQTVSTFKIHRKVEKSFSRFRWCSGNQQHYVYLQIKVILEKCRQTMFKRINLFKCVVLSIH